MTKETKKRIYRFFWQIIVAGATLLPFIYIWSERLNILLRARYENKGNIMMWGLYLILMLVFLYTFNAFTIGDGRKSHLLIGQGVAYFCLNIIEIMITILMVGRVKHIKAILVAYLILYVIQLVELFVFTSLGTDLYRKLIPPYQMLHIYGDNNNNLAIKMSGHRAKYHFEEEVSYHMDLEQLKEKIKKYDAILVNDLPAKERNILIKYCFEIKKRVYFTPKISDIILKASNDMNLLDTPLYLCKNMDISLPRRFVKRAMDIVISLVGIVITSPIMLVTAIAIYAYDKGPVIYKQVRCTKDLKEYEICKFRSMIVDAEKDGKARLAKDHDDRITPVGKWIRRLRIDELPQFFNILAGDMSVVGPRPERPELIAKNCEKVPEFVYRTRVKAGLTGYAQVYGRYNTSFYDKLKLDLIYVNNYSIALDIRLIMMTLKIIFMKESTEGV